MEVSIGYLKTAMIGKHSTLQTRTNVLILGLADAEYIKKEVTLPNTVTNKLIKDATSNVAHVPG